MLLLPLFSIAVAAIVCYLFLFFGGRYCFLLLLLLLLMTIMMMLLLFLLLGVANPIPLKPTTLNP